MTVNSLDEGPWTQFQDAPSSPEVQTCLRCGQHGEKAPNPVLSSCSKSRFHSMTSSVGPCMEDGADILIPSGLRFRAPVSVDPTDGDAGRAKQAVGD